ncbi:unnamed protein product [Rotaria magnacalcarata]|uniref:Uncharacterized protein n=1 Tax=Rotaria magnacalcarata TaxID=392030 RepID=A0A816QBL1_9BILA|nr:unnamed protein product [Rotaria magnacalcarata]
MGLCHSSKSSLPETWNTNENLGIYTIIWLDNNKKKSQQNLSIQRKLRTIINHFKIFQNEDACEEHIKSMSDDDYIILITNDQIGEKFIPRIHNSQQIFSIYIHAQNKNIDQRWMNQFPKIKSIYVNYDELIKRIELDQIKYKNITNKILFEIFHSDEKNDSNQKFIYWQILIDILLQMDSMPNDMIDFLSLCRMQYKGNKVHLNIIREFQQNYRPDAAIWWFTRDTFISQLLNKALRVRNMDVLFFLRFFIHNIERQLKEYRCLTPIQVYRYELILNKEMEMLKNSIGQYISINNFLLTKLDRNLALISSNTPVEIKDVQPILFEIAADSNHDKTKPFAKIKSLSYLNNDQDDVLFMLGSIFQLKNIHQDDNGLWIVEMVLSNRTNTQLKPIFTDYKDDDDDDDLDLLSFGCILEKMNELDEAKKYYSRLCNELSDDDESIGSCLLNLGNIDFIKHNYDASLDWLSKSLDISLRTLQPNDMFFARIYYGMGHAYNQKDDSKSAIEYYDKALIIWKQSVDDNYLNIAECINNIGIIYKHDKDYLIALDYFKKTLNILEKYVTNDDFDISKAHCNIASTYRTLEEYDLALEHYQLSFKILEKHYLSDHPNIAKALGNIGIVYALKRDEDQALSYYERAADIYRNTLPPTHINNIKIDQLIRNLSSLHRKVSFGTIDTR